MLVAILYSIGIIITGRCLYRVYKEYEKKGDDESTIPFYTGLAIFWPFTITIWIIIDLMIIIWPIFAYIFPSIGKVIFFCLIYKNPIPDGASK